MKKLLSLLLIAGAYLGFVACKETPVGDSTITLDRTSEILYFDEALGAGESLPLQATVSPDPDQKVYWVSSSPSVASVDEDGVVRALALGTTTITASLENKAYATCLIEVQAQVPPVREIILSSTTLEMEPLTDQTLTWTFKPDGAQGTIVWSSDNEKVATVANGKITAVGPGKAIILAKVGMVEATCEVTVKNIDYEVSRGLCGTTLRWVLFNHADGRRVLTITGSGRMRDFTFQGGDAATACPWWGWMETITEVVLPERLTSIGTYAFDGATALTTINMQPEIISIGDYAFRNCPELTLATTALPANLEFLGAFAFENCAKLSGDLTLSSKLTALRPGTFRNCTGLTGTLIIPVNIKGNMGVATDVANSANRGIFEGCTGLTKVEFATGSQITDIAWNTFAGCTGLTEVTLAEGLVRIGRGAFDSCSELTAITFPSTINEVPWFGGCDKLMEVTILREDSILGLSTYIAPYNVLEGEGENQQIVTKYHYAFPTFDRDLGKEEAVVVNQSGVTANYVVGLDTGGGNTLKVPAALVESYRTIYDPNRTPIQVHWRATFNNIVAI